MKTDWKHLFRWLESTPWTESPLYHGRSQKPEEQAKYDVAMATKTGISKTSYALLDCFGGLSKIHKVVVVIAVLVVLLSVGTFAQTTLQKPFAANLANVPPQSEIDNWKAGENRIPIAIRGSGRFAVESTTIEKIEYGSHLESRGGNGIPTGTVLYPLRMHILQVVNPVQKFSGMPGGAYRGATTYRVAPGMEHEIVDVCFYQDVFGKWLHYADNPQIVDYIQTGPTPAPQPTPVLISGTQISIILGELHSGTNITIPAGSTLKLYDDQDNYFKTIVTEAKMGAYIVGDPSTDKEIHVGLNSPA